MASVAWMSLAIERHGRGAVDRPNMCATLIDMSDRKDPGAVGVAPIDTEHTDVISKLMGIDRRAAGIPDAPRCADCGVGLEEPFGWCSNCRAAFCAACGDQHFCMERCKAAGCIAGLCVRDVNDGVLSLEWKRPGSPR
jgi:hypothetical protein